MAGKLLKSLPKSALQSPLKGRSYPAVSLFSGAGGLDLGLRQAGFIPRLMIDSDPSCCKTLESNKRRYWPGCTIKGADVRKQTVKRVLGAELGSVRIALLAGGPPCQPFSKSAFWSPSRWDDRRLRRPAPSEHRPASSFRGIKDPRAESMNFFLKTLSKISPAAYIMENVRGLSYKTSKPALSKLLKGLSEAGYTHNHKVLNAADYGAPQERERLFIVGARDGVKLSFPEPTHCPRENLSEHPEREPYVSAGEAIGDLDDGGGKESERVEGKWGRLLPEIPPGDNYLFFTKKRGNPTPRFKWRSRYWSFLLKLSPDKPSWTIQAQPGPNIGPFHWRNRRLRISEIKRLQTFPDDYEIHGSRSKAQRQLGNAVPPLLAKKIGKSIKQQLLDAELL